MDVDQIIYVCGHVGYFTPLSRADIADEEAKLCPTCEKDADQHPAYDAEAARDDTEDMLDSYYKAYPALATFELQQKFTQLRMDIEANIDDVTHIIGDAMHNESTRNIVEFFNKFLKAPMQYEIESGMWIHSDIKAELSVSVHTVPRVKEMCFVHVNKCGVSLPMNGCSDTWIANYGEVVERLLTQEFTPDITIDTLNEEQHDNS